MLTSSIVICTKDRAADLQRCLDSLCSQSIAPDQLIVVDSGSDETILHVQAFEDRCKSVSVRYVRSEPGLTRQRNLGINEASGDIIHFFDDDITLHTEYLRRAKDVFENDAEVVGFGPKVNLRERPTTAANGFRKIFQMPLIAGDGKLFASAFGTYTWYSAKTNIHRVEVLGGCCCAFRRNVFDHILFDEYFQGYGYLEDLDFSYRVSKLGKIVCDPSAEIWHWESPAARTRWRRLAKMEIVNHYYIFRKNLPQDFLHKLCFWWSEIGMSIRRIKFFLRSRDMEILRGMLDGYRMILRGEIADFAGK